MTTLYAQPYDISANGFFFETVEEYNQKSSGNFNQIGHPVEEYEIEFIDGEDINVELFKAIGIHQSNIADFLEACDNWSDNEKYKVIIATGEGHYSFDFKMHTPDDFDVDIYEMDTMKELAEYFADEGLFGNIPEHIQNYIDYEAMARDLRMDYSEITIAGKRFIYRCL